MKLRRRDVEVFSLSFMDCICCGFGAIILLMVLTDVSHPIVIERSRDAMEGQLLRLDRLVRRRDSGEWWVLDHKSAERPEQQAQLLAHMGRYRRAVQTAQPGAVVRLAFINATGQLIELPAETETP